LAASIELASDRKTVASNTTAVFRLQRVVVVFIGVVRVKAKGGRMKEVELEGEEMSKAEWRLTRDRREEVERRDVVFIG
jgi:hypothetical protein